MASSDDEMPDAHLSAHISLSAPPDDPELHSVVTDFVDYTEYFPSDMIRSLTLIRQLDDKYQAATQQVHEYALRLGKPVADAAELRRQMSRALGQATTFREAACAEADRLSESASRNGKRLGLIRRKLQALPLPPSRDPTPVPVSPVAARARKEVEKTPRLTLHVDKARNTLKHRRVLVPGEVLPPPSASDGAYTQTEESSADELDDGVLEVIERRGRKAGGIKVPKTPRVRAPKPPKPARVRVPGQMGTNVHSQVAGISTSNALAMLTPPPADAKPGSKHMPWFKLTEYEMAYLRKHMKKNAVWTPSETMIRRFLKEHFRGPEFYEKAKAEADAKGEELLDEDPMDPNKTELGPGEVAPNMPSGQSQALENRGMRLNVAKKEKAAARKEQAEKEAAEAASAAATGTAVPTTITVTEEAGSSKKPKKEKASKKDRPARPSSRKGALQSVVQSMNTDLDFGNLFTSNATPIHESITISLPGTSKKSSKSSKKRKRESEKQVAVPAAQSPAANDTPPQPGPKKLKINHPSLAPKSAGKQKEPISPTKTTTVTTTTQIPLAPAGPSPTRPSSKRATAPDPISPTDMRGLPIQPTAAQSRPRRVSGSVRNTIETPADTPTAPPAKEVKIEEARDRDLRPRSRGSMTGKAASAEPPSKPVRETRERRRASVIDTHPASDSATTSSTSATQPRTTRANRRPAPGFVTAAEDGKGKVSVGKRKAAPKKGAKTGAGKEVDEVEEAVDPNEPRYCICGDVSWGTMVACENAEVSSYTAVALVDKG
jgi:hypothetical protein